MIVSYTLFFYCQMFFYFVEEAVEKKPHLIAFAIYPPLKRGGGSLFFVFKATIPRCGIGLWFIF